MRAGAAYAAGHPAAKPVLGAERRAGTRAFRPICSSTLYSKRSEQPPVAAVRDLYISVTPHHTRTCPTGIETTIRRLLETKGNWAGMVRQSLRLQHHSKRPTRRRRINVIKLRPGDGHPQMLLPCISSFPALLFPFFRDALFTYCLRDQGGVWEGFENRAGSIENVSARWHTEEVAV